MINGQRLSSITTRIKTCSHKREIWFIFVKDYLPLQQGLRLCAFVVMALVQAVKDYLPLQQGLRQACNSLYNAP